MGRKQEEDYRWPKSKTGCPYRIIRKSPIIFYFLKEKLQKHHIETMNIFNEEKNSKFQGKFLVSFWKIKHGRKLVLTGSKNFLT